MAPMTVTDEEATNASWHRTQKLYLEFLLLNQVGGVQISRAPNIAVTKCNEGMNGGVR